MIGKLYAHPNITKYMSEHSVARKKYGTFFRNLFRIAGPMIMRIFGYPLDMEIQRRVKPTAQLIDLEEGDVLLDVGCGVGYFSFGLGSEECDYKENGAINHMTVGLDIDIEDVKLANKVKNENNLIDVFFIAGNGVDAPFKKGSFDRILASEIIEHLRDDEIFLRQLRGLVKDDGRIVVTTPYQAEPIEYSKEHFKKVKGANIKGGHVRSGYSVKTLQGKLEAAGLRSLEHRFSYGKLTKLGRSLIKMIGWFGAPPAWILSSLEDNIKVKEGKCLIVAAEKSA